MAGRGPSAGAWEWSWTVWVPSAQEEAQRAPQEQRYPFPRDSVGERGRSQGPASKCAGARGVAACDAGSQICLKVQPLRWPWPRD